MLVLAWFPCSRAGTSIWDAFPRWSMGTRMQFYVKKCKLLLAFNEGCPDLDQILIFANSYDFSRNFITELKSILEILNLDSGSISPSLDKDKLKLNQNLQLINKAMLYSGERTGIVYDLLSELYKLGNKTFGEVLSSSLGHIFTDSNSFTEIQNIEFIELLEIFRLNTSQEKAIINSLSKPITSTGSFSFFFEFGAFAPPLPWKT